MEHLHAQSFILKHSFIHDCHQNEAQPQTTEYCESHNPHRNCESG